VKYFFLALILTVIQPLPPLPRQAVNKQAEKTTAKAQVSNNRQNPSDPSPSIVVVNNCSNEHSNADASKNEASSLHPNSQKQPEPWSRSEKLTLAYDILTGLLVVIALGTGIAVAFQAVKTAEATQAMRDSTAIQQAQLVQWVELPEWEGGKEISLDEADEPEHFLMLTFPIVNPTNYPMTLDRIEWVITEQSAEQKGSLSFNGITFPPRERHPTVIYYTMTMDQVHRYAGDDGQHQEIFYLDIGGTVHFIDISKKPQSQEFWVRLHCYHGKGVLAWKPYRTAGLVANKKAWRKQTEEDK
jgi:hypothetical protein